MGDYIMISKFTVSNYKGFKDEIVLDLSKTRDYEFNKDLIKNGNVNKGIIYGKNGTGKTNLGLALYDITSHLTDKRKPDDFKSIYRNLDSIDSFSKFKYEFDFEGEKIVYEYAKTSLFELVYEIVHINEKKIILYNYYTKDKNFIDVIGAENLNVDLPDNKLSILKYIYKNTPTNSNSPITKIVQFAEGMLWFRCLDDRNKYIGFYNETGYLDHQIIKNNKVKDFEDFLKKFDLNYNLEAREINNDNVIVAKFKNGYALFDAISSSGTKSIKLFYCWSLFFDKVSFLFLDEFDAFYHFEMSELIIKAINDNNNIQTIVTSHNTYLMKNSLTRPDCCFVLSNGKINSLSDCTDKEIREAHNLEKMYRNGAFTE